MASASTSHGLDDFLKETRDLFLTYEDKASAGPVKIVMGNEAGDLDSVACAVAFSYFRHKLNKDEPRWFPLVQTDRNDFRLRAENILAMRESSIHGSNLITLDDFVKVAGNPKNPRLPLEVALVDHCKLASAWKQDLPVTVVLDHHVDEGLYKDSNPRLIKPPTECGSCSSLLTETYLPALQEKRISPGIDISRLLLTAVMIDTHNMDRKIGKAKDIDYAASTRLLQLSALDDQKGTLSNELYMNLAREKESVSHLNTFDLCRRDYKEYQHPSSDSFTSWLVGLTSVPGSLQEWLARVGAEAFIEGCTQFCVARDIQLLGILTSFSDEIGFHRQVLLFSPPRSDTDFLQRVQSVASLLEKKQEELNLKPNRSVGIPSTEQMGQPFIRVWDQLNLKATRKQVAPAVKDVCSQVPAPAQ